MHVIKALATVVWQVVPQTLNFWL